MPDLLGEQLRATSLLEWIAVLSGIAYLLLAVRQNIWCWFFAALSSGIFVYIFIDVKLYMESVLNLFYFLMAIYGYYVWQFPPLNAASLPVTRWPLLTHVCALLVIGLASVVSALVLSRFTDAVFPLLDSLTTFAALWTTFLVARKVFENWWYWLVIDAVSIGLYLSRELVLTSLLFAIYLLIIPFGMRAWRKSIRHERIA